MATGVVVVALSVGLSTVSAGVDEGPEGQAAGGVTNSSIHVESETVDFVAKPTEDYLPCTGAREPANFTFYSLGPAFEESPLVAVLRECGKPFPEVDEPIRPNSVTFIYGLAPDLPCVDTSDDGEGGCTPPIQVISEPVCEIGPADYDWGQGGHGYTLRGVPAADFDDGARVELYAGETTITISGSDPDQVKQAVGALQAEPGGNAPADPSSGGDKGSGGDFEEPLPGAMGGTLRCDNGSYGTA